MGKGGLDKLTITGFADPGFNSQAKTRPNPIKVMINPNQYSQAMGVCYTKQQGAGGTGPDGFYQPNDVVTDTNGNPLPTGRYRLSASGAYTVTSPVMAIGISDADASDAVTVQDFEGHILAWNPGAVRLYGWTDAAE